MLGLGVGLGLGLTPAPQPAEAETPQEEGAVLQPTAPPAEEDGEPEVSRSG
jgi:hypothetical protein